MESDPRVVNLLWTGGWDSTFRLLNLLLIEKRRVQPYYLIDAHRRSTGMEIRAMRAIKDRLFEEHPYTRELLLPTLYSETADVPPDEEITRAFCAIGQREHIGEQYDWLARFCKQAGIFDMEMCIYYLEQNLHVAMPFINEYPGGSGSVFRFDETSTTAPEYTLFRYYTFPLYPLNKLKMRALAQERGWMGYMNLTWFCHHPRGNGVPCGTCKPCVYTIEEGMGWRLPAYSRLRYTLRWDKRLKPARRAVGSIVRRWRALSMRRKHT
jgi:hypothetical protein